VGEVGACVGRDPRLFDSLGLLDHLEARKVCATCPMVTACIERAIAISNKHSYCRSRRAPDGTWGGLLWHDGKVVDLRLERLMCGAA
jgi:hypothetical protein